MYGYLDAGEICVEYVFGGPNPGSAASCAHAETGVRLGTGVVFGHGTSAVLAALVPDGTATITVNDAAGTSVIPVNNNVAIYQGGTVSSWHFINAAGEAFQETVGKPPPMRSGEPLPSGSTE